ncbi:3'-phosphoadenosine 5'-phosphosulfate sulfotransferase [Xylographa carneopallida]|nr:3'-phosphoadenosine 5'-phosphosulfate sulfotransferase [Xylographa carneopallida]
MTEAAQVSLANGVAASVNGYTPLRALCILLRSRIEAFLQEDLATQKLRNVQAQTRIALDVIIEALNRYSLPALSLSYNGGKDCLVLLIVYLAALADHSDLPSSLESIYIVPPHPFPEVNTFVASSSITYHLSLTHFSRESMKAAFADYLAVKPEVKAIFVGTRRTDPHGGKLTHFDPTDGGWPPFMRIHPVIDWHYTEIWEFLRHLEIPYCELYDMGYTSLGGTTDTSPNPALRIGEDTYKPAYELVEDDEERLGRDR